jgi:putative transposase
MKSTAPPRAPSSPLSDEAFKQLSRRMIVARDLKSRPNRSRYDIELVAEELGVHASTVYRDMRRLQGRGTVDDLVPHARGWPEGRSKLHPRQDELIDQFLRSSFLTTAKATMVSVARQIGDACEDEGLSRPTRAAVIKRRDRIPKREVAAKRDGPKAAEQHTPRPGKFEVNRPWDVWQIDHTLTDVIIIDGQGRPIGRAWLTALIDVYSRIIPGFYVGLDAPSTIRVATTLDLAVGPKGAWLAKHGYDYEWPVEGLPKLLHSDRAKEFTSDVLKRAMGNQGTEIFLRPPGRVRFGGHIERLIGTLMGTCRLLPGATHNSPTARGSYDSKGSARLTLDQLQDYFAHQILGVYHNRVHSALGVSPLEAWKTATQGRFAEFPEDIGSFRRDLFPEMTRTLGRQGVQAFNEDYYCREIGEAFIAGVREVRVKYDPRDLSKLYVYLPEVGYVTVPYRLPLDCPAPTYWLYKAASRQRAPLDAGRASRQTMRRATAAAEQVVQDASSRSMKAARQAERLIRDRQGAAEFSSRIGVAPLPSDDDWGGAFGGGE